MEVKVTAEFDGMEDGKKVPFRVGDIIEGPNAQWALDNGHGRLPRSAPEPAPAQPRKGNQQQPKGQDGQ